MDQSFDSDLLSTVLESIFPDRDVTSVSAPGPSWNENNSMMAVAFANGEIMFVKMANDGDSSRIRRERTVIDYVGTTHEIPLPALLASQITGDVPYLIMSPMPGKRLDRYWSSATTAEKATTLRAVGTTLAELHADRFEAHGHIVGGTADALRLETGPWAEVLVDRIDTVRNLASSRRFEQYYDRVTTAVEDNRTVLNEAPAAIVHGDPHRRTVFRWMVESASSTGSSHMWVIRPGNSTEHRTSRSGRETATRPSG